MADIVFVHGMFQNPKSWENWNGFFAARGHHIITPAWPLHQGEPAMLRDHPPAGLGDLRLTQVIESIEQHLVGLKEPVMIGHSVGGLITQILLNKGLIKAGVAIDSVAPNAMIELDWDFIKNSAIIANPFAGNDPIMMDAQTFHGAFANTLSEAEAARAFAATATHDSRNVLRDCMGADGKVDVDLPHGPLLLIGGEQDQIIPGDLTARNFEAYSDRESVTELKIFHGRSHYICNEPGWEEVAAHALDFIERHTAALAPQALP